MNSFVKAIFDLDELEQYGRRPLAVNKWSPVFKILWTLVFIVLVSAVGKYSLSRVLLLAIYPVLMVAYLDIPYKNFLSKLLIPAALSISLGIANPFFDRAMVLSLGGLGISGGVLSLITLFIKGMLTVSASLILVSTTSISGIGDGLLAMKVPKRLVMLLLLMYRYITVLLNETGRTIEAYHLRSGDRKGIHISSWGSLVGQIMIRSYRRSGEIYNAMQLRGYGE